MITRLSISERLNILEEYRDRLFKLTNEVWDILTEKFAPYDSRDSGKDYSYADVKNYSKAYDDKDAPLLGELFNTLDMLYGKFRERAAAVEYEDGMRAEAQEMFYAWDLGLCPYVMREYRRQKAPDAGNSLYWHEIAAFLKEKHMSRIDTISAVEAWQLERYGAAKKSA